MIPPPATETVDSPVRVLLTWDYEDRSAQARKLYLGARRTQWDPVDDIEWGVDVSPPVGVEPTSWFDHGSFERSPLRQRGIEAWNDFRWQLQVWMTSQFLHGEVGALAAAGRLVETLPTIELKQVAAMQAVDEARHVEVFSRYLNEKVGDMYPVDPSLQALVGDIMRRPEWDFTFLGMQIVVEAIAATAFRVAQYTFHGELIRRILENVERDEARHVAFGTVAMMGCRDELLSSELREREEFVLEASELMRRRFLLHDVWERIDVDPRAGAEFADVDPAMRAYRQTVFTKVVSSLQRIDMLTPPVVEGLQRMGLMR